MGILPIEEQILIVLVRCTSSFSPTDFVTLTRSTVRLRPCAPIRRADFVQPTRSVPPPPTDSSPREAYSKECLGGRCPKNRRGQRHKNGKRQSIPPRRKENRRSAAFGLSDIIAKTYFFTSIGAK